MRDRNNIGDYHFVSVWSLVIVGALGFVSFACGSAMLAIILWSQYGLPALSVLCGIAGLLLFGRTLRIRLVIGPDKIVVRNVFWTYRLPWGDVSQIGWRLLMLGFASAVHPDSPALAFKLHNGKVCRATATGGLGREKARVLVETIQTFAAPHAVPVDITAEDLRGWPPSDLPKTPPMS